MRGRKRETDAELQRWPGELVGSRDSRAPTIAVALRNAGMLKSETPLFSTVRARVHSSAMGDFTLGVTLAALEAIGAWDGITDDTSTDEVCHCFLKLRTAGTAYTCAPRAELETWWTRYVHHTDPIVLLRLVNLLSVPV